MINKKILSIFILFLTPFTQCFCPPSKPQNILLKKIKQFFLGKDVLDTILPESWKGHKPKFKIKKRSNEEVEKFLSKFNNHTNPQKSLSILAFPENIQPIFEEFYRLIQNIKKTLNSRQFDALTHIQKKVVTEFLKGDKSKLASSAGKKYSQKLEQKLLDEHYKLLNELIYLELGMFLILQRIGSNLDYENYKSKFTFGFQTLAEKEMFRIKNEDIYKGLSNIITKVLGHKPKTSEYSKVWAALLTKRYPIALSTEELQKKYPVDMIAQITDFLESRRKIFSRLIYKKLGKLAITISAVSQHVDPEKLNALIEDYRIEYTNGNKKFEAWQKKYKKQLTAISKKIKKIKQKKKDYEQANTSFIQTLDTAHTKFETQHKQIKSTFESIYKKIEAYLNKLTGEEKKKVQASIEKLEKRETEARSTASEQLKKGQRKWAKDETLKKKLIKATTVANKILEEKITKLKEIAKKLEESKRLEKIEKTLKKAVSSGKISGS